MPRMEKGEYLRVDKTEDLPYTSIFLKWRNDNDDELEGFAKIAWK
jgi:hypothetical protein